VAHTNADVADPGVSDALGEVLGLTDLRPLEPAADATMNKLVVFVPVPDAERLIDALASAGAGAIGDYDRCAWVSEGKGTFRPLDGARPAIGHVGEVETIREARVEMVVPVGRRADVVAALRAAHPYEEPAFDVLMQAPLATGRGSGRIGELPTKMTLREFTRHAAASLPSTAWGVRAAGDPSRSINRVAVCGGAGGSLASAARYSGADVLLTADLRHHPVSEEAVERDDGIALIDAAHWATEAPWLDVVATRLRERFGTTVDVRVSQIVTDPWTMHEPSTASRG
jgi:hypothetical protein